MKTDKPVTLRSQWEFGEASECRRGLMRGMGYSEQELKRPLIGIVNSWNEYNPGHVHLDKLAERVKQGVREAGGLPVEVMTTALCDGMVLKDPRYIEVPSRNSIADQVEMTVEGNFFDKDGIQTIADIPSRDVLLAKFLGSIQPPVSKAVRTFQAIADAKAE